MIKLLAGTPIKETLQWQNLVVIIPGNPAANPAPPGCASLASHMIAAFNLLCSSTAFRTVFDAHALICIGPEGGIIFVDASLLVFLIMTLWTKLCFALVANGIFGSIYFFSLQVYSLITRWIGTVNQILVLSHFKRQNVSFVAGKFLWRLQNFINHFSAKGSIAAIVQTLEANCSAAVHKMQNILL